MAPGSTYARTTGLKDVKRKIDNDLATIRSQYPANGVTIVSDGWSDRRNRPLLNTLASSRGHVEFLDAIDTSGFTKDGVYIAGHLENAINAAGKVITNKYPHITFTPCAAHTLDLMLEDIGKQPWASDVVQQSKGLMLFITKYQKILHLFRYVPCVVFAC